MAVFPYHPRPQVFLSYRGQQLRYNFISHLTNAFERHGFNFFQDKDEHRGKDMKNLFVRIQESRIALVIFSDRYGESKWCLEELVKIKKLADKGKLEVIPIFYNVKAREVRWQSGEFGDKFWALAKTASGDEIKKWKDALECIANKMGLSLGPKSSEADFIKKIIKKVEKVAVGIERDERREDRYVSLDENKKRKIWDCSYELLHFKRTKTHKCLCRHCNNGI